MMVSKRRSLLDYLKTHDTERYKTVITRSESVSNAPNRARNPTVFCARMGFQNIPRIAFDMRRTTGGFSSSPIFKAA